MLRSRKAGTDVPGHGHIASDNGKDLTGGDLFIAFPPEGMRTRRHRVTKRIGVENSGEARDYPWRFVEAK
jgi:3-methyladenine DNA glycosylase Mpg